MLLLSLSTAVGPLLRPSAGRVGAPPVAQATRLSWDELRSDLDMLPVFAITNPAGAPLEYERDGRTLALCFADPAAAQQARCVRASCTCALRALHVADWAHHPFRMQELAKTRELYPNLNLALRATGLGTSLDRVRAGTALFVPGAHLPTPTHSRTYLLTC